MTLEQTIEAVVRKAVAEAIAEIVPRLGTPSAGPLLTRDELARALNVSRATLQRLEAEDMPRIYVGDSPRFELAVAKEWLSARGKKAAAPANDTDRVVLKSRGAQ